MTFSILYKKLICNCAADNSLHSIEDNVKEVKTILNKNFKLLEVFF